MLVKFAENFSEACRHAGERLLSAGRVDALFGSHELFRAEVCDESLYECSWRIEKNRLLPECDCAEFKAGVLCPHLWAALCLAQNQQALTKSLQKNISRKIPLPSSEKASAEQDFSYEYERRGSSREKTAEMDALEARFQTMHKPAVVSRISGVSTAEILYVINLDRQNPEQASLFVETWWKSVGGDGKSVCRPFFPEANSTVSERLDEQVLGLLLKLKRSSELPANVFQVPSKKLDEMLSLLAGSGRLRWYSSGEKPLRFRRLNFADGNPLPLRFVLESLPSGQYELRAVLPTPKKTYTLQELLFLGACEVVLTAEQLFRLDMTAAPTLAVQLWQENRRNPVGCILSARTAAGLCRRSYLEGWQHALEHPAELTCQVSVGTPKGILFIQSAEFKFDGREQLHAELSFEYGGNRCIPEHPGRFLAGIKPGEILERDFQLETALQLRLESLGFSREGKDHHAWRLLPSRLDQAVRTLVLEDWHITAAGKTYRRPTEKKAQVQGAGMDWFEVSGEVDFSGQKMPLPMLLRALRRGQQSVRLDDGTYGILPLEWLEKFTVLTEIGEGAGEKIRVRRQQAAILAALLEERLQDADGQFSRTLEALQVFEQPKATAPPPGFAAELRPYQAIGLGWLMAMGQAGLGVCLADDMGLGKTVQVLALLAWRKQQGAAFPSLVVLPHSLIFNWSSEAERFAPMLRQGFYLGTQRNQMLKKLDSVDVLFTTYGTLRQDPAPLAGKRFDYCILDESQAIKNADSATAKAVRTIRADHRLAMTGTPVENRLAELFSQLEFLNPGLFGESFLRQFSGGQLILSAEQSARLQKAVRPFLLRRTKEAVASELPPKREQVIFCELEGEQRASYDELKEYYRQQQQQKEKEGGAQKLEALTALLRLRQAACHPGLLNEQRCNEISAKQEFLLERLDELAQAGQKALVFSQFSRFLRLLQPGLQQLGLRYCYLDGATTNRAELVQQFQEDADIPVFLISLKAGGVGLNLTAAEYVFILDPWWNPAAEAQAVDRAYRIGQTKPVFAYRLIARNTVEEKVMQLQQNKRRLAETVLAAAPQQGLALTPQDIAYLLE
ncbi:MAG: DEAD/DEAH box helicase [Lentisphaerae bacterium]|nr:DEAD/DEAH box helicase [Lentisphaerota bacterium]